MIILDEINGEIAKLEAQTQTYQTIEKLAALYVVRDHNTLSRSSPALLDTSPAQLEGKSPFLSACAGEPVCVIMAIMDELMSTVQIMQPRLYEAVMRKLAE